ncbi:MAG: TetR/AcrR family transcriptional regulator [Cyanobacteria bacterium J06632_3]
MAHASSLETKEQILDVAESEIAQHGYAGTTLRNVVSQAGVNLAAVHYHFGSKEDLFRAVIGRISQPIVSTQLNDLDALLSRPDATPSVQEILWAYLRSSFEVVLKDSQAHPMRGQFVRRCRTEPEPVQSIASAQFAPSTEKFLDALQRALPNQTRSQLTWKLDLVITSLIYTLAQAGKPNALLMGDSPEEIETAVSKLIAFVLPGMESS